MSTTQNNNLIMKGVEGLKYFSQNSNKTEEKEPKLIEIKNNFVFISRSSQSVDN